jgi:hypothetical protein
MDNLLTKQLMVYEFPANSEPGVSKKRKEGGPLFATPEL